MLLTTQAVRRRRLYILSYGMGVESHAILERWINEPWTRPFEEWTDLIVIVAQVGEENQADTIPNVVRRTLPLLRALGVRFVEVSRRGPTKKDGVVVLQDTRAPERLHPEGVYRLSDELLAAGVVPHAAGEHRCAIKHKCLTVDAWVDAFVFGKGDVPMYDSSGALLKPGVLDENEVSPAEPPIVVFGYNADEGSRIDRCKEFDGPRRSSAFPLQVWGWGRQQCAAYIFERCGIVWTKSHCSFCPFCAEAAKGEQAAIARWLAAPEQTAHGLLVEYNSMCFNPRGHLFANRSLISVIRQNRVSVVLDAFERRLASVNWGLYRVRRLYTRKGKANRAVEKLAEGTREAVEKSLDELAVREAVGFETISGIRYGYFHRRSENMYPSAEGFLVVAPLFVGTKVRGKMEVFDDRWRAVVEGKALPPTVELDDAQEELPLGAAA